MINLTVEHRGELVKFASGFSSNTAHSEGVIRHAEALLAWVQQAGGDADLTARMLALRIYNFNSAADPVHGPVEDSPAAFLDGANPIYLFLAGCSAPEGLDGKDVDVSVLEQWLADGAGAPGRQPGPRADES